MDLPCHGNSDVIDAGDIESMPFIEALGQFSYRVGKYFFGKRLLGELERLRTDHSFISIYGIFCLISSRSWELLLGPCQSCSGLERGR